MSPIPAEMVEQISSAMRAKRAELQHAPLDRIYGELFTAGLEALMALRSDLDPVLNYIAGNDTSELARCQASEAYMSGALDRELKLHEETRQELENVRTNCAATSNSYLARALAAEAKLAALGDTHVMVRKLPESAQFMCVLNEDEVLITHPNHRPLIFNLKTKTAEALKAEAQPGSQG